MASGQAHPKPRARVRISRHPVHVRRRRVALGAVLLVTLMVVAGLTWARQDRTAAADLATGPVPTTPAAEGDPAAELTWVQTENELPGTTDWFFPVEESADESELAGYPTTASVTPGTPVELRIDNRVSATQRITVYRLGWYAGTGGREVVSTDWLPAAPQPDPRVVEKEGGRQVNLVDAANWTTSALLPTTDWVPGTYIFVVEADTGHRTMIPFTVRSPDLAGRTVLVNATVTWHAYNRYGGYSSYKGWDQASDDFVHAARARRISMDRPLDRAFAVDHFLVMERGLIAEAERLGLDLGYVSNVDLSEPDAVTRLSGARAVVTLGHDEYWTNEHAATMAALRDDGTNLLIAGANTMWWRIRFLPGMRQFDLYKAIEEDPVTDPGQATVNFSVADSQRLLGSRYVCFRVDAPLVVVDPDMFLFAGTGAVAGSSYPGLNRIEVDRASPGAANPPNLSIAAQSPVDCRGVPGMAHLTWYTAASGAGVINLGSMGFVAAVDPLHRDRLPMPEESVTFARTVVANALQAIAQGPLGAQHRPPSNLAAVLDDA